MLYLLTGVGLALFAVAVAALVGLVRSGQLDDLDTPPARMLADDPEAAPTTGRPDDRTAGRSPPDHR